MTFQPGTGLTDTAAFDMLSLPELEEASGELHRRIGIALRHTGEPRADDPDGAGLSPRRRVAEYAALLEVTAATLASIAAGTSPPGGRYDQHPAAVLAVLYATPTIPALLGRLEQNRRMLASLTRTLESRLGDTHATAWGTLPLRRLVVSASIVEAARCAQALDRHLAALDAAEAQADL